MEQEFSESDRLLKHELESVQRSCISHVSCWCCGSILCLIKKRWQVRALLMTNILSLNKLNSVKTFRENSID